MAGTEGPQSPTSPKTPEFRDAEEKPDVQHLRPSTETPRHSQQSDRNRRHLSGTHEDLTKQDPSQEHDTPTTPDPEKESIPSPLHEQSNPRSTESSNSSDLKKHIDGSDDPNDPNSQVPTLDALTNDLTRPPSLNYTLRTRKLAIAVFWTLILIDCIAIPLILYFCLHYLTDLSPNAVFSISTGCLGGISVAEYFIRFWRLWKKGSVCRVIGARRWYLDWFHWNFSIAWIFIMVELIVGTIPKYPPIRLLAMPVSSLLFWFAFELLMIDAFRFLHMPAPMRISSVPKGAPMRPAIYSIIEDVCAVDGSGGTEFRKRLNARYVASHYFRQMLHRLTIYWAFGMLACAIVTTTLVFTLDKEPAYVVGWALPFVWAGIMIPPTFIYVFRCLRREYAKWPERRTSV